MTDLWDTPPRRPHLHPGEVHLWLKRSCPPDPRDIRLLDPGEQARMANFRHERERVAFACARAFLRRTLSGYLDVDPAGVRFVAGRWGRPEPAQEHGASSPLSFSLAHSEDIVLLAVSLHPVGVDVEAIRELPDVDQLVERTLTAAETELLIQGGESHRSRSFLQLWTRKEAFLKGIGVGLAVAPEDADVAFPEFPVLRTTVPGLSPEAAGGWRIISVHPTPEAVGALAVQGVDARLHRFEAPRAGDGAQHP